MTIDRGGMLAIVACRAAREVVGGGKAPASVVVEEGKVLGVVVLIVGLVFGSYYG